MGPVARVWTNLDLRKTTGSFLPSRDLASYAQVGSSVSEVPKVVQSMHAIGPVFYRWPFDRASRFIVALDRGLLRDVKEAHLILNKIGLLESLAQGLRSLVTLKVEWCCENFAELVRANQASLQSVSLLFCSIGQGALLGKALGACTKLESLELSLCTQEVRELLESFASMQAPLARFSMSRGPALSGYIDDERLVKAIMSVVQSCRPAEVDLSAVCPRMLEPYIRDGLPGVRRLSGVSLGMYLSILGKHNELEHVSLDDGPCHFGRNMCPPLHRMNVLSLQCDVNPVTAVSFAMVMANRKCPMKRLEFKCREEEPNSLVSLFYTLETMSFKGPVLVHELDLELRADRLREPRVDEILFNLAASIRCETFRFRSDLSSIDPHDLLCILHMNPQLSVLDLDFHPASHSIPWVDALAGMHQLTYLRLPVCECDTEVLLDVLSTLMTLPRLREMECIVPNHQLVDTEAIRDMASRQHPLKEGEWRVVRVKDRAGGHATVVHSF